MCRMGSYDNSNLNILRNKKELEKMSTEEFLEFLKERMKYWIKEYKEAKKKGLID